MVHIVSFFSFKVGVGRSVLLANVASILAMRDRRVACIDFDLEAGGLHTIFGIESVEIKHNLLDHLTGDLPSLYEAVLDLTNKLPSPPSDRRRLLLLPTISNYKKLNRIDTDPERLGADLRTIIKRLVVRYNPEFVLVDTRAGYAELAYGPLDVANSLVVVMRLNKQNTEGLRLFFDVLSNITNPPAHSVVVSQVPDVPEAAAMIERVNSGLGVGRPISATIPYDPQLALEEKVLALLNPASVVGSGYEKVADWIQARANEVG